MTDTLREQGFRIAWVTGASSGIGRAVALALAAEGLVVAATARNAEDLATLVGEAEAKGGTIVPYTGDVTNAEGIAAITTQIAAAQGPIDLAVLNAGIFIPVKVEPFDLGAFKKTFDVNLGGTVACIAAVLPAMTARRSGRIVIVSSVTGYFGMPSSAAYGATKAALTNLAESLKFDLDRVGVSIQVVNPGFVDTPSTKKNKFKMPALVPVEVAGQRIVEGIAGGRFEITFPKRFTYVLKAIRFLPYGAYFWLVAKATGWDKKTD